MRLLELTRLDAGQEQIKRLKFDFSQVVVDCVELIRPLAAERHVELHSRYASRLRSQVIRAALPRW